MLPNLKEKIIEGAHSLFIRYGMRSVSMDDVARELSVSKKTLYQYFDKKDELVTEAVKHHMEGERKEFDEIKAASGNAIEELHNLAKCMRDHVFKINPTLMFDLRKYHAEGWKLFIDFKNDFLKSQIIHNINRGKEEGYFRSSLNAEILAILRIETVQLVFDNQLFPTNEYNMVDVQLAVFDHFVHGLLTEKGKELYQHYQLQESN